MCLRAEDSEEAAASSRPEGLLPGKQLKLQPLDTSKVREVLKSQQTSVVQWRAGSTVLV